MRYRYRIFCLVQGGIRTSIPVPISHILPSTERYLYCDVSILTSQYRYHLNSRVSPVPVPLMVSIVNTGWRVMNLYFLMCFVLRTNVRWYNNVLVIFIFRTWWILQWCSVILTNTVIVCVALFYVVECSASELTNQSLIFLPSLSALPHSSEAGLLESTWVSVYAVVSFA